MTASPEQRRVAREMLEAEMKFAQVKGEIAMRQTEAQMTMAEVDAIGEAFKEQSATARNRYSLGRPRRAAAHTSRGHPIRFTITSTIGAQDDDNATPTRRSRNN